MSAPADRTRRERALDPRASFLVQAPAGSGKTGLLIQRFLRLLAGVEHPEEIVAITFTRKAAAEMRQRITAALREAAEAGGEPHARTTRELARAALARDAQRGWQLLEHPGRLRIQTIDALCASLTRQMPWLSRFGAEPNLVEDARGLYREAARATIAQIDAAVPWADAVATVLAHLDDDVRRLEQMLVEMLARRDQWLRHVAGGGASSRARLEAALGRAVGDALAELRAAVPAALADEIAALAARAGAYLRGRDPASPIAACADLTGLPGAGPGDLPAWTGIAELLLTREDAWRAQHTVREGLPARGVAGAAETKARARALRERLAGEERLRERLAGVRHLPAPGYGAAQWAVLEALARTLEVSAGLLRVTFGERGQVDFAEVAQAAVEALGEEEAPTDLALALDYRIAHLLVDEFQDTSHTQLRLLERLTAGWTPGDGRSLFLVGDPMQSIYRFREADVGLFLRARREGVGRVPLEHLRLRVSFRARPRLVEWVNATFSRVFPRTADVASGAVPHAASEAFREPAPGAAVVLHARSGDDPEAEAQAVVRVVRQRLAQAPGASIAVLVRARPHLVGILRALRAARVPVRGVDVESLAQRPVVQDLLALTRALLQPADRVAWLAVLRAPWCGLALADLHALAGGDGDATVLERLRDPRRVARLSAPAKVRLRRVHAVLEAALGERSRRGLRRSVEGTWCALGGPACIEAPALEDAEACLELLEGLEDDTPDGAALEAALADLFAHPGPARASVEAMTIHKAKGLEFDTVILPGLGRATRGEDRRLLAWSERTLAAGAFDLLLAPVEAAGADEDRTARYLRRLEGERAALETVRLLYVAATRAREQLHLFGHLSPGPAGGEPAPRTGSLLACLWPALAGEFRAALAARPAPAPAPAPPAPAAVLRRLPAEWSPPPPPAPLAPRPAAPPPPAPSAAVEFAWAGHAARHVGTVVHRVLRHMAGEGLRAWDAHRVAALAPGLRLRLAELGVAPEALEAAAQRAAEALHAVLADPRAAWLLDPEHREARSEYALSGLLDGRLVEAVIDRTFVDADGTRWIVDYKTGVHEGADAEAFLDRERVRYAPQLERYARLLRALEPRRRVRLGLYFPLLQGWREWAA